MAQRTDDTVDNSGSRTSGEGARPSDELLPFLNNFHDIFTTIGVLILMGGLAVGTGQVMSSLGLDEGDTNWQFALMGLIGGIAIVLWSLSALLVGRQRRILPGIVLCVGFVVAAAILIVWGYGQFLIHGVGNSEATFMAWSLAAKPSRSLCRKFRGRYGSCRSSWGSRPLSQAPFSTSVSVYRSRAA